MANFKHFVMIIFRSSYQSRSPFLSPAGLPFKLRSCVSEDSTYRKRSVFLTAGEPSCIMKGSILQVGLWPMGRSFILHSFKYQNIQELFHIILVHILSGLTHNIRMFIFISDRYKDKWTLSI